MSTEIRPETPLLAGSPRRRRALAIWKPRSSENRPLRDSFVGKSSPLRDGTPKMSRRFRKVSLSNFPLFRLIDRVLTQPAAPLVEHVAISILSANRRNHRRFILSL